MSMCVSCVDGSPGCAGPRRRAWRIREERPQGQVGKGREGWQGESKGGRRARRWRSRSCSAAVCCFCGQVSEGLVYRIKGLGLHLNSEEKEGSRRFPHWPLITGCRHPAKHLPRPWLLPSWSRRPAVSPVPSPAPRGSSEQRPPRCATTAGPWKHGREG